VSTPLSTSNTSSALLAERPPKSSLPWAWFGFVFAAAFFIEEFLSIFLELDAAVTKSVLLLIGLAGWIFWLFCVGRFHTILYQISRHQYSISNVEAVGKHFIPFYNFVWLFTWPAVLTGYLNRRGRVKIVSGYALSAILLISLLTMRFFDGGLGLIGIFLVTTYISHKLSGHLGNISPGVLPPLPNPDWFEDQATPPQLETDRSERV
jgi:hypothetical protein